MASPGETDATVTDLVLDFLASKGFADAEAALREQLDAAEAPPVASEGISPLEMMLIRGRTAASESQVCTLWAFSRSPPPPPRGVRA